AVPPSPRGTERARSLAGRRSRRERTGERAGQLADPLGSRLVGTPVTAEQLRRTASIELRPRSSEPAPDAKLVVAPGQVSNDQSEKMQPIRDLIRGGALAAGVATGAGDGHADQLRQQFEPQCAEQRPPLVLGNRGLLQLVEEPPQCCAYPFRRRRRCRDRSDGVAANTRAVHDL